MGKQEIEKVFKSKKEELTFTEICKRVDEGKASVNRALKSMRDAGEIKWRQEYIYPCKTYIYQLK